MGEYAERESTCDRDGKFAEQRLISKNLRLGLPANLTVMDAQDKYVGDGQRIYTKVSSNNVVCIDNWGYFSENLDLHPVQKSSSSQAHDCPWEILDKYGQNMYHFIFTDGVQESAVRGKDILEVGCGRGKGAAYIAQNFGPKKYHGMDLNKVRIELAKQFWGETPNLQFMVGNAMDIPMDNAKMDIVVNVESSFHYPNFTKFLSEVYRVLKPGGLFLWSAPLLNRNDTVAKKKDAFATAGFRLIKAIDISTSVVEARKQNLLRARSTEFEAFCQSLEDWDPIWEYYGFPGSLAFKALQSGELPYIRFVAEKPTQ